ncbi:ANTAR domain-containing protein [Streptacidiphilus sp. PB12-B1b]|uniref:ANTAR domain-containing protein n=1 Tax=Streptacidiphilus sp. PB12-B1b TaxID=2705012 RepID=UPI0015FD55AF|nr:ANTAR domain-containing protein [Streptacidiphilus sp. PB12-B1b]QMU77202.1 ANTAR domain-containing protein [Streptacidiphilus sp. PB12-B1b]
MAADRAARIAVLVAEQAVRRGGPVGLVDVCAAAQASLPIGGASVCAMSPAVAGYPLCSTDAAGEQLQELQLQLGEGPSVDAFARGSTVWAPDLGADEARLRWPVFAPAAVDAGARALYSVPLQIGAISPGVLDLYAQLPLLLSPPELAEAMAFADCATLVLLNTRAADREGLAAAFDGNPGGYCAEIDQATGMLTGQLGVGIEEASVRLRAYAYAHDRRLSEVSADVVDRRLRFSPDVGPGPVPRAADEPP